MQTFNCVLTELFMLGIEIVGYHPHNELVHLPYIAVATNTKAH